MICILSLDLRQRSTRRISPPRGLENIAAGVVFAVRREIFVCFRLPVQLFPERNVSRRGCEQDGPGFRKRFIVRRVVARLIY